MGLPNQITLLRILLIPLFLYFLLSVSLPYAPIIAAGLFAFIALSDAFDGYLARKLDSITELGKLLDPIADKALVYAALLGLIEIGKISSVPVLIILVRDLCVAGMRVWASKKGKIIAAEPLGKWKTAFQMISIVFLILNWPMRYLIFWLSVLLSVLSGLDYFNKLDIKEA